MRIINKTTRFFAAGCELPGCHMLTDDRIADILRRAIDPLQGSEMRCFVQFHSIKGPDFVEAMSSVYRKLSCRLVRGFTVISVFFENVSLSRYEYAAIVAFDDDLTHTSRLTEWWSQVGSGSSLNFRA